MIFQVRILSHTTLSLELSREGREGKPIGTTFMIGSAPEVLARSTQLILNPFEGHPRSARNMTNHEIRETVKELSQIDGAFIIAGDGTIEAAGGTSLSIPARLPSPKVLVPVMHPWQALPRKHRLSGSCSPRAGGRSRSSRTEGSSG